MLKRRETPLLTTVAWVTMSLIDTVVGRLVADTRGFQTSV